MDYSISIGLQYVTGSDYTVTASKESTFLAEFITLNTLDDVVNDIDYGYISWVYDRYDVFDSVIFKIVIAGQIPTGNNLYKATKTFTM